MTVFKDVRKLATATAGAAIQIIKGKTPPTTGKVNTKGRAPEPAYLIPPQTINKSNWQMLTTGGFLKKSRDLQRRVQEVLLVIRLAVTYEQRRPPGRLRS